MNGQGGYVFAVLYFRCQASWRWNGRKFSVFYVFSIKLGYDVTSSLEKTKMMSSQLYLCAPVHSYTTAITSTLVRVTDVFIRNVLILFHINHGCHWSPIK
jgi:hypothetical protein